MEKTNLVVGAGFSGATVARLLADHGERVLVIDRRSHIAGNCYDYRDENGIMIHAYGSHIFHTSNEDVWHFIRRFTNFNNYEHRVLGYIDGLEVPIPFNLNSIYAVFSEKKAQKLEKQLITKFGYGKKIPIMDFIKDEDPDLRALAEYVYEKVFFHYTIKQWGCSPQEIDASVTGRVPIFVSKDNRYFQDKYQGIPTEGYTEVVRKMLDHPLIELKLDTDYAKIGAEGFDRLFYTGSIDEYYGYSYGILPYRSVYFRHSIMNCEHFLSNAVINHPCDKQYTREHEYKYYLGDKSNRTVVTREYSEEFVIGKNERSYPIPKEDNRLIYFRYLGKVNDDKHNIFFLGRLGDYTYYDMDKAIERAISLIQSIYSPGKDD